MVEIEFEAAPLWLTESYLEPVLKKYKKDKSLKIVSLVIRPATAKGENYASVMTRVTVSFKQRKSNQITEESYLLKTSHENDPKVCQVMEHYKPYLTEMLMYEKVLPELQALLEEIGDQDKLFAKTIHVDYEHSAIIFEDLSLENYRLADRVVQLDKAHILLSLKKIAKMHATSAVLNERRSNFLTQFDRGIFNSFTQGFRHFFEGTIAVAADFAGSCPDLGVYYKEKLLKVKEKVMDRASKAREPKDDSFNTLTHGDFWTNNILFSYNEEASPTSVKDLKFIDFQFCSWGPPAVDLYYFLHTSWQPEFKFNHYEELLKYYHDNLVEVLNKLNYQGHIPSLKEFWVQMTTTSFLEVPYSLSCQALMVNTETDDADFNAMMGDDERARRFKRTLYKNDVIRNSTKRLLPIFDKKGLLDNED